MRDHKPFRPGFASSRSPEDELDEAIGEDGHAFPAATRAFAIARASQRVAQAPAASPATAAHQRSDKASRKAALSALEHYASSMDAIAKNLVVGITKAGTGPGQNAVFDNLNGARDLTEHTLAYCKEIGLSAGALHSVTIARVEQAIARVEAELATVAKLPARRKPGDANPKKLQARLGELRVVIGTDASKRTAMTGTELSRLRDVSLDTNVDAAIAAIESIEVGNHGDIDRLAAHLRELAMLEPAVDLENPAGYEAAKAKLTGVLTRLGQLEAKVPAVRSHAGCVAQRKRLEVELAKGPYGP